MPVTYDIQRKKNMVINRLQLAADEYEHDDKI